MVGRSSGSWRRAAECGEAKEERGGHVGSIGAWAAVRGGGDLEGMGETREEVYSDSGDNSRSTFPGSSGERDSRGLRRDEGMGIMDECVEEVVWPAQETTVKQVGNGKMTRRLSADGDLSRVVKMIKKSKRIMVVTGAGISASCGIPTFRGDGQFYQTVAQEFGLPHGHSVMDVRYFREDPRPFYRVARRLYPTDCTPSPTHDFIRRLERAGKLLRDYTQNIDTLEKSAGIKRVVYCHGSFASASCTTCGASYEGREIERDIRAARVPRCMQCVGDAPVGVREWVPDENSSEESVSEGDMDRDGGGVIKPDIVFFHEDLPADFYSSLERDKEKADLLLVMGTSLSVAPVSYIPMLMADTPSILINSEPLEGVEGVFDVFVEGECDTAIWGLLSQGLNKELPPTGIDTVGRWQRKRVRGAGGRIAASPRRMSLDKFLRGSSSAPEAMGDLGRCLRMMHKAGDMGVKELKRVLKKVGGVAAQGAARRMSGWLVRETGSRTISKGEEDFRRVRRRLRDELEKGLTKGFGLRALRQLEEGRGIEGRESLYVLGSS